MGLTSDITEALQEAFNGDLLDAVTAIDLAYYTSAYNTTTGAVTPTKTTVATRGVIEPVANEAIDGEVVLATDTLFTILLAELAAIPKVGDTLEVGGIVYNINIVIVDPANVAWTITGRAV